MEITGGAGHTGGPYGVLVVVLTRGVKRFTGLLS
ncbi:hypothetical protein J2853_001587 [Streptosporangium lutulentum]|uniref:Uncharacterized protein n=1 Tax=Streptosporangium lutulentum TaxID=1461250 RepID=A0ABT9Q7K7_9ACTN|nr:hypothetical protein [Streptosporangium lutulentum]